MQSNKSNGQLTAQISMNDHKKSGFDLSNNVLGTGKIGRIIPTRALHVMPGDTINQDSKVAVQFEPLAVPILANMQVRQEHFYTPYNIVWKNWDKFISSGEKLDYHGVVPNTNLKSILSVVTEKLLPQLNLLDIDYDEVQGAPEEKSGLKVIRCYNTIADFGFMETALESVGDTYYIKDLLKPQFEALKVWRENYQNYSYEDLFYVYRKGISESEANNILNGSPLSGNKYFEEIRPYLFDQLVNGPTVETLPIPTEYGLQFVIDLYNYLRSFIGFSSNIDYLNMGRFSIPDMLVYVCSVLYAHSHNNIINIFEQGQTIANSYISELPISILHLRANYNIWYNNYRDILLEADAFEPYDGDNITDDELFVLLVPRQRCWEKDAFTTALDNPGTGNVGVPVGMQNFGTVGEYDTFVQDIDITNVPEVNADANNIYKVEIDGSTWYLPTAYLTGINQQDNGENANSAGGFSLYQLDAAQRAQKWLQKALFFGNRISDFYYMHFGVRFLDARLRLPELLTSSTELVKLDVVMNNTNITTEVGGEVYQSIAGDRAAYASAYDNGNSFSRFCEEHGVIMSYLTIMPQVTYAYGMNRDYSRLDQFDFAFSEFATLGMDAVYDSEITASTFKTKPSVFGYQGKYYDYKAKHSEEHGELLDSQDMYTFSRKFNMFGEETRPKLNYEFVHCFPSLDMFVVDSELADYFRYDIRHSTAAERNLPSQSIYI